MLTVESVTKDFGGLRALDAVTFTVDKGQLFGLVGPNGSGKTTCFNVITGFLRPSEGRIVFKGERISGLAPHAIAKKGISRTFQLTSLFPDLSVIENVKTGVHRHLEMYWPLMILQSVSGIPGLRRSEEAATERSLEILRVLGMGKKTGELACNLAHVDQKKLELAVALAAGPELLLLDEVAAGMLWEEISELSNVLRSLKAGGLTVILVDHNMRFIMNLCERIVVLHHGAKIAEGSPEEIRANNQVREVYLGRSKHA